VSLRAYQGTNAGRVTGLGGEGAVGVEVGMSVDAGQYVVEADNITPVDTLARARTSWMSQNVVVYDHRQGFALQMFTIAYTYDADRSPQTRH
jgi:hypothetical protein